MAPQSVNVTTSSTYLFTPGPGASVQIFNAGPALCYIGGGAFGGTGTAVVGTSFPLTPNSTINWYNGYNYGVGTTGTTAMTIFGITASGVTTINITSDSS
jgi:hypothetical protein